MTKRKNMEKYRLKILKWIYAFLLPTIIIFVMFYVQPIVVMLTTSFTKWDGFNDPAFNGISNYIKLFTNSASAASIKNLILWSVIAMTFHVGFGVLTAFVFISETSRMEIHTFCIYDTKYYFSSSVGIDLPVYFQ